MYEYGYPNLELLEYKFRSTLANDEEYMQLLKQKTEENCFFGPSYDVVVFSQIWGNTSLGIDQLNDGSVNFGGSAMTKAYTTVIKEELLEYYAVFFHDKLAYIVHDANERFHKDLKEHNMLPSSKAKEFY